MLAKTPAFRTLAVLLTLCLASVALAPTAAAQCTAPQTIEVAPGVYVTVGVLLCNGEACYVGRRANDGIYCSEIVPTVLDLLP